MFTGDNQKLTAYLSGEARERESLYNADYKKRRAAMQEKLHLEQDENENLKRKESLNA